MLEKTVLYVEFRVRPLGLGGNVYGHDFYHHADGTHPVAFSNGSLSKERSYRHPTTPNSKSLPTHLVRINRKGGAEIILKRNPNQFPHPSVVRVVTKYSRPAPPGRGPSSSSSGPWGRRTGRRAAEMLAASVVRLSTSCCTLGLPVVRRPLGLGAS